MNVFTAISAATQVFQKGKAVSWSSVVTNTEAGISAIYGLISAIVVLLNAFGIQTNIAGTDLHDIANGTTALASLGYSIYRAATNPATGV